MKLLSHVFFLTLFSISSFQSSAQYRLVSDFANTSVCDTMTRGPFCVWWDKKFPEPVDVSKFLDSLVKFRNVIRSEFKMQDPPNLENGNYINYYLHRPDDVFPNWFGNFKSAESNGNVFVTIPYGYHLNYPNAAHETFHVFQHFLGSSGFYYTPDGQWFTEASANWFKVLMYPKEVNAYLTNEVLIRVPHVPLWYGWNNRPSHHPQNWQRETHQYALGYFWYFLTEAKGVSRNLIADGFNIGTDLIPQEYYITTIGVDTFRGYFMDWLKDILNRFEFQYEYQVTRALKEWYDYSDPKDDKQYVRQYIDEGTDGWFRPADTVVTTAWAFNNYKILNSQDEIYTFELKGDPFSTEGDPTYFEGMVMIQNESNGTTYIPLEMLNNQEGSLSVQLTSQDTAISFVVSSMPQVYEKVENLFPYEIRVQKGIAVNTETVSILNSLNLAPNPTSELALLQLNTPLKKDAQVQLMSFNGQLMQAYIFPAGSLNLEIPVQNYPSGTYFLSIHSQGQTQIKKLVVK